VPRVTSNRCLVWSPGWSPGAGYRGAGECPEISWTPTGHFESCGFKTKNSAEGPVSRILSCAVIPLGAALPRTLISDLPGGFGNSSRHPSNKNLLPWTPPEPPKAHRADTQRRLVLEHPSDEDLSLGTPRLAAASLPIWSCSVWGLPCLLPYDRSGALLPHLFTLTPAPNPAAN